MSDHVSRAAKPCGLGVLGHDVGDTAGLVNEGGLLA